jgi:hypothetical protein
MAKKTKKEIMKNFTDHSWGTFVISSMAEKHGVEPSEVRDAILNAVDKVEIIGDSKVMVFEINSEDQSVNKETFYLTQFSSIIERFTHEAQKVWESPEELVNEMPEKVAFTLMHILDEILGIEVPQNRTLH